MAMQTPAKRIINTGPAPAAPYSMAVAAGGLVYVSGTLAQDASGAIAAKGDVAAQTRTVLERIRSVLASAGSSLDRVVAVTIYLRSASDFQAMNAVYRTFWERDLPTRTTVMTDLVLPDALVEMSMIAVAAGGERKVVQPAGWLQSPNPYSYAIRTGDTMFLSGLTSRNIRDNSVVTGDMTTQTRTIMENAAALLSAAGLGLDNVVSARVFITDIGSFQAMNDEYRRHFKAAPPARATVKAGLSSSEYVVEITMVASSAPRRAINPGTVNPNLSSAIEAGGRLYLSGVLGNTADNKGDAGAQTGQILSSIRRTLEAAGYSPADVVDGIVYLTDIRQYSAMNEAYRPFFAPAFPARATVIVPLVAPDAAVEIMTTAVKP
jgi:aminoacrylate peracid reductase